MSSAEEAPKALVFRSRALFPHSIPLGGLAAMGFGDSLPLFPAHRSSTAHRCKVTYNKREARDSLLLLQYLVTFCLYKASPPSV